MKLFSKIIITLLLLQGVVLAKDVNDDNLYTYKADIISIYDGDTVTALISVGFNIFTEQKIRLYGIDAPEVKGKSRGEGLKSRDWLRSKILNKSILIKTIKDKKGKYGRYLGILYLNGENINDSLVSNGYAVYREY